MKPATKLFFLILTGTAAVIIYMNLYTTSPLPNSPAFFKINRLTGSTQLCVPSVDGLRCRDAAEFTEIRAKDAKGGAEAQSAAAAARAAGCVPVGRRQEVENAAKVAERSGSISDVALNASFARFLPDCAQ